MRSTAAILLFAGVLSAAEKPAQVAIDNPRSVTVSEGDREPTRIYVGRNQLTTLLLPAQEKIKATFISDETQWILKTTSEPSRYLAIKVADPQTDSTALTVVSDHDKPYLFILVLSKEHVDSKVTINPDAQLAVKLNEPPAFVPAAEARRAEQAEKAANERADQIAAKAKEDVQNEETSFRAKYRSSLHFDYEWDHKVGDKFGVTQIYHDDKFTYIRAHSQEAPMLYEVKDGKPSYIAFDLADDGYVARKILDQGYLLIGKKEKMEFSRKAAD